MEGVGSGRLLEEERFGDAEKDNHHPYELRVLPKSLAKNTLPLSRIAGRLLTLHRELAIRLDTLRTRTFYFYDSPSYLEMKEASYLIKQIIRKEKNKRLQNLPVKLDAYWFHHHFSLVRESWLSPRTWLLHQIAGKGISCVSSYYFFAV